MLDEEEMEEPEGGGSSLAQEDGRFLDDDDIVVPIRASYLPLPDYEDSLPIYTKTSAETPESPINDILEYDVTLPNPEETLSRNSNIRRDNERNIPLASLSPKLSLGQPADNFLQTPGFFRSHRKLHF